MQIKLQNEKPQQAGRTAHGVSAYVLYVFNACRIPTDKKAGRQATAALHNLPTPTLCNHCCAHRQEVSHTLSHVLPVLIL